MKIIKWEWRGQIMTDYFPVSWLQVSRHFEGHKYWSWEFHWKGSNAWYRNFRRYNTDRKFGWAKTRLTFRFGKHIMVIGIVDMVKYYKDVKVLEIKYRGKVTYKCKPLSLDIKKTPFVPDDVVKAVDDMKKMYYLLNKDYPDNSWRN